MSAEDSLYDPARGPQSGQTWYVAGPLELARRAEEARRVAAYWTPDVQGPLPDGYYWFRREAGRHAHVREIHGRCEIVGRFGYDVKWSYGEWFGPFSAEDFEQLVEWRQTEAET